MAGGPPYPWSPPVHLRMPAPPPKRWTVLTGRYACAFMWFWIMYRFKEDGDVLMGWRHSWEHRGEKHNVFPKSAEELAARFAPDTTPQVAENN